MFFLPKKLIFIKKIIFRGISFFQKVKKTSLEDGVRSICSDIAVSL